MDFKQLRYMYAFDIFSLSIAYQPYSNLQLYPIKEYVKKKYRESHRKLTIFDFNVMKSVLKY